MRIFEAVILGAVQGITEFLPVSSSGHLVVLQQVFGIEGPVLLFDTMLHLGTLAAVFTVFRQDLWRLARRPLQPLTALLCIATVPAAAAALLFKARIDAAFESGAYTGFGFLITSLLLMVSERRERRTRARGTKNEYTVTMPDALVIGLFQAAALVPGISRSGATVSAALLRRIDRSFAARFSFLLSVPVILGALVLQVRNGFPSAEFSAVGLAPLCAGALTAGIVGFFSVKLMLKLTRKSDLWIFALYTALLGAAVLTDQHLTHLFFPAATAAASGGT
jgi:undecaprenyl-diphosphatase